MKIKKKKKRNTHQRAAGTHADLCLLATSQEGDKHLVPPQDSDSNTSVQAQEDGVQGGGDGA